MKYLINSLLIIIVLSLLLSIFIINNKYICKILLCITGVVLSFLFISINYNVDDIDDVKDIIYNYKKNTNEILGGAEPFGNDDVSCGEYKSYIELYFKIENTNRLDHESPINGIDNYIKFLLNKAGKKKNNWSNTDWSNTDWSNTDWSTINWSEIEEIMGKNTNKIMGKNTNKINVEIGNIMGKNTNKINGEIVDIIEYDIRGKKKGTLEEEKGSLEEEKGIYEFINYGGGDCEYSLFINLLAKKNNVNTKHTNFDIVNYVPSIGPFNEIHNNFIRNNDDGKINIKDDNSLDLVIAAQSLHHIMFDADKEKEYTVVKSEFMAKLEGIISNIVKKIKIGGLFYIREHDVKDTNILSQVVYEHLKYSIKEKEELSDENKLRDFIDAYHTSNILNFAGFYFSKETLKNIMEKNGMELLKSVEHTSIYSYSNTYNSLFEKVYIIDNGNKIEDISLTDDCKDFNWRNVNKRGFKKLSKINTSNIYDIIKKFKTNEYIKLGRKYSQNDEDGIINTIFNIIGTTNKYYVEFGVEDGTECNTRLLRDEKKWEGVMFDGGNENEEKELHKHMITRENIVELFIFYKVNKNLDLLSIDIDGMDYYICEELLTGNIYKNTEKKQATSVAEETISDATSVAEETISDATSVAEETISDATSDAYQEEVVNKYRPRLLIIEYNCTYDEDKKMEYKTTYMWEKGNPFEGSSLIAINNLLVSHGYILVQVNSVNAFFIEQTTYNNFKEYFPDAGNVEKFLLEKNPIVEILSKKKNL